MADILLSRTSRQMYHRGQSFMSFMIFTIFIINIICIIIIIILIIVDSCFVKTYKKEN